MNKKILPLLFLLFAIISGSYSQSRLPKYIVVSNAYYHQELVHNPNFKYVSQYSGDSMYVKIIHTEIPSNGVVDARLKPIAPAQKISSQWKTNDTFQLINIACFDEEGLKSVRLMFEKAELFGTILYERTGFLSIKVKIKVTEIVKLQAVEDIKFISFYPPAVREINFVERSNHRVARMAPNFPATSFLTGKGITMGIWDGGDVGIHIDFDSRLTLVKKLGINSHATHVAGTMAGAGNLEPDARGMAPEAKIYSWDFNGDIPIEMDTNKIKLGYVLTQNSYGYWTNNCADFALYDITSTDMDRLSIKHPDLLHVFAAGNSRGMNCVAGGYKTILPGFQSAKNTISVAAINSTDGDSYFSCAGPTQDGRFKPEISAVGVNVYSTQNLNTYAGGWNGTSMATPGASGTIALLYERFKAKYGYIPPNYLAKNIISNTTDDIGNVGPDFLFGFGRINGQVGVNLIDSGFWNIDSLANNAYYLDTIYLTSGLNELKVMLTWNDVEVNASSSPILVNDLDLTVTDSTGTEFKTWWCNPNSPTALAIRQRDSLNNIEQVTVKNPLRGRYIIKVYGKNIPVGNQTFAVSYWKDAKALTVVYPDGKETMASPSSAAKAQIIRWDSKGVTGNYTLEFSRDSGTSWQTIATNIPNTQRSYTWQTLQDTVSTGRALIRIGNGTVKDASNNVFSITGGNVGLNATVCDSQVFLRWRTTPKADFYRVQMLVNGKMKEMGTTKDTSFLISKLVNGQMYWFSVSNRKLNGAESPRTIAISATPNNSIKPPRIVIQPKDTNICFSNVFYQKSTATGTSTVTAIWQFSNNNGQTWSNISNTIDSLNLRNYVPDFSYTVRRVYLNACLAPVITRTAVIRLDSVLVVKFYNRDTIVCKGSTITDSIKIVSKIPPIVSWYNDTLSTSVLLQKSNSPYFIAKKTKPMSIWAEVLNLCGNVKTKDLTKPASGNGRNEYTLFAAPAIAIADTLIACVGETIIINPVLSGGRPGFQKLMIKTEDSVHFKNSINRKITKDQVVYLYYFDNCYPDTTIKKVVVKMRNPLSIDLRNDSTICYGSNASLKAIASGGKGTYNYTWADTSLLVDTRVVTLKSNKIFKVTLTDNCTEKPAVDSVLIQVLPALQFTLTTNSDTLCSGNLLSFNLTPSGGRIATRKITWSDTGLTGTTPSIVPKKSTVYKVILSDGCSINAVDSIGVFVRDPLKIKIDKKDTLCNGKQTTLTAQLSGGLAGKQVVQWLPLNKIGASVSYTPTVTQNIIAEVSDGCTTPSVADTLQVNVYQPLQILLNNFSISCYGAPLSLAVNSSGGKTNTQKYYWDNKEEKTTWIDSFNTKSYVAKVTDGCMDTMSRNVLITVLPKLSMTPLYIRKCGYNDTIVNFKTNTGFPAIITWDKKPTGARQTFTDKVSAFYVATINDGCSDTTVVNVPIAVSDFSANQLKIDKVILKTAMLKLDASDYQTTIDWNDGFKTTESDTSASHLYKEYGNYTVCKIQTDEIGCSDTICQIIANPDPVNFKNYRITVFPNPVKDVLNFSFNQLSYAVNVQIFDATGKRILEDGMIYPAYSSYSINLNGISPGIYTLKVISNGEVFVVKFVKID
ncbi:MAG: S8 family serine peptidase [Bacteroidota bacterium]